MDSNELSTNKVLIFFDAVFDIDFGLFQLIKKEFRNPEFVNLDIIDNPDNEFHKKLLYERSNPNPLSVYLKPNIDEQTQIDLYVQFILDRYKDIVKLSCETDGARLMAAMCQSSSDIEVFIACKDEEEIYKISNYLVNYNDYECKKTFVPYMTYDDINISEYDTIFIRNYYDLTRFDLGGQNIIVSSCKYNKILQNDEYVLNPAVTIKLIDKVVVREFDMYNFTKTYEAKRSNLS